MNHSPKHSAGPSKPKPYRNALERLQLALRRNTKVDIAAAVDRIRYELFGPLIDQKVEPIRFDPAGPDCREVVSEVADDGPDESASSHDPQRNADSRVSGDQALPPTEPPSSGPRIRSGISVVKARSGSGKWLDPTYADW